MIQHIAIVRIIHKLQGATAPLKLTVNEEARAEVLQSLLVNMSTPDTTV